MKALIFDKVKTKWEESVGFELVDIAEPVLDEANPPAGGLSDANYVILKVHYAGICGTDRGIWNRQAFKEQILSSIDQEGKTYRQLGHEFFGEVVKVGSSVKDFKPGDMAACESHVVCNQCFQCLNGQKEVCINEKILGISHDGGFAEFAKVPAQVLWKTDVNKIRPEVAAMQEPFGNAVHAASKVDLKGKTVAIFGLGPIAAFLILIVKGLGAKTIIGIEPNDKALEMGKQLGVDHFIKLSVDSKQNTEKPYAHNQEVIDQIMKLTGGLGVDVAFEMAGFNNSVNNSIAAVRRGGDVILFGLKTGDFVLENYNRLIMKGVTMHCVAGRQIWGTWEITKRLIENKENGVQEKLFNIILNRGKDTILPIGEYSKEKFEDMMQKHSKFLIKF